MIENHFFCPPKILNSTKVSNNNNNNIIIIIIIIIIFNEETFSQISGFQKGPRKMQKKKKNASVSMKVSIICWSVGHFMVN